MGDHRRPGYYGRQHPTAQRKGDLEATDQSRSGDCNVHRRARRTSIPPIRRSPRRVRDYRRLRWRQLLPRHTGRAWTDGSLPGGCSWPALVAVIRSCTSLSENAGLAPAFSLSMMGRLRNGRLSPFQTMCVERRGGTMKTKFALWLIACAVMFGNALMAQTWGTSSDAAVSVPAAAFTPWF